MGENQDRCPACRSERLEAFYRQNGIPVHSCLLLQSKQEALAFPRDDLELGLCRDCGFICNVRFDRRWMAYAPEYEDQQAFSPTFKQFARSLAGHLIERYSLRGKTVMEIGCGKGDFLRLICQLGANRGIGIDPSVDPGRFDEGSSTDIEWVAEYFHPRHARFEVDFICCRHTLEHIPDVGDFLATLREVIGARRVPVVIEVPDTKRVLADCAFEDIYYEHCSYFTEGSLNRLFRSHGFGIRDSYLAYGEQYLILEADAGDQGDSPAADGEESADETRVLVESFRAGIGDKLAALQQQIDDSRGRGLALWGSGSKCVSLLSSLNFGEEVPCVVDINPHRHGKFIAGSGLEIHAPEILKEFRPQSVIAMNRIYTDEIRASLDALGIKPKLTAL
jgi:SAM-dependent methyltransferase